MGIFPLRPGDNGRYPSLEVIVLAAIEEVKAAGKPATLENIQIFLEAVARFHATNKEVMEVMFKHQGEF